MRRRGSRVEEKQSNEPDALIYEWFLSEDGTSCRVYERYADSAATVTHLQAFGQNIADRMLAVSQPTAFTVFGDPSEEVRQVLDGFGAVYMKQEAGFAR